MSRSEEDDLEKTTAMNTPLGPSGSEGEQTISGAETPSDSAPMNVDLIGRVLGDFRLLRRLGKGGMSEVYLAEQISLKRNVAVKIMRADMLSDETYLGRFKTEAMAAANLNHPNIVQVYMIGEADGLHFIAQEYVKGRNLREFIHKKKDPISAVVALHVMRQVASALQKASEVGIVHRDIKPENIMITSDGMVKVADFGLALLAMGETRQSLTQEGVTMGTPLYMSPEQVQGSKVDHRSDLYSLGVTIYHMLAKRPPFRGESAVAIAVKHVNQLPKPLEEVRPDLPQSFCHVVGRLMAKAPVQRYADANALLADLKKVTRELNDKGAGNVETDEFDSTSNSQVAAAINAPAPKRTTPQKWFSPKMIKYSLIMLVIGAGLGVLARGRDPFQSKAPESSITRKDTAKEQLVMTILSDYNEEALAKVLEYHPNSFEAKVARARLGILYLNQRRYRDAEQQFHSFLSLSPPENLWLATGYAGKLIGATLQQDYVTANRLAADHKSLFTKSLEGALQVELARAIRHLQQQAPGPATSKGYEEFLARVEDEETGDS